jgi:hypothetical protein
MNKWIDRVERRLGVPTAADAYYVAKTAAYTVEDCGSCLQIAVNQARDHLSPELLRNVLGGRAERLSPDLQAVYRFAQLQADRIDDEELRELLIRAYGEEGFIELATNMRVRGCFRRSSGHSVSRRVVRSFM